jgi:ketosteroid isomerase-like protein
VSTNEQVMQEYVDAVLTGGDFARCFSTDVLWTTMETGDEVRGREAVRDLIVFLHSQAFDAQIELRRLVVSEDGAVIEGVFRGRQTAECFGVAPAGGSVVAPYAVGYDLVGGSITALRAYFPVWQVQEQLRSAAGLAHV